MDRQQPVAPATAASRVSTEPQATINQPVALDVDHAPAGAAEAGIDAENANRR